MSAAADERRREMDKQMTIVMANHSTVLQNQEYVITQLGHQHDCMEALKREVADTREILADIRAIMSTFKIMGMAVKWTAVTSAALVSLWHGLKAAFQFWK